MRRALSAMPLVLLAACAGDGASPPLPADGGPPPSLTLGVGEGRFRAFEDGETLDLVTGCQGSQHVWIALRSRGLGTARNVVELQASRDRDGARAASDLRVRLNFRGLDDGSAEVVGLTLVIPLPEEVLGEDLTVEASVEDQDGRRASDRRGPVRVAWAPGGCREGPAG